MMQGCGDDGGVRGRGGGVWGFCLCGGGDGRWMMDEGMGACQGAWWCVMYDVDLDGEDRGVRDRVGW